MFWPSDQKWTQNFERLAPRKIARALGCRRGIELSSKLVQSRWISGLSSLVAHKTSWVPFGFQSAAIRWCDRDLGRCAGQIASKKHSALLSYSYYAHSAFSSHQGNEPRILFQLHPHPASVRSILRRELELNPDCASSLNKEWELVLPEGEYQQLVEEVSMAQHWIVASQFTKETLVQAHIPSEAIYVVPYGIDSETFTCKKYSAPEKGRPLRLLFVGTLGQRKGIKYLVDALKLLPAGSVHMTFCGRPVDDLALLRDTSLPIEVFPSISSEGLREAYHSADVFVFPSLAEGFGHVLLEAMASGLSIISTTRTAAPDLIRHGREGFIINSGSAAELAAAIENYLRQPERIVSMGLAARNRAEFFTWKRFRQGVSSFVGGIINQSSSPSPVYQCSSY